MQDLLASVFGPRSMYGTGKVYFDFFLYPDANADQGAGLLYVPSLALVGLSFSSKETLRL